MHSQDHSACVERASNGDPVAIDVLLVNHLATLTAYLRLHAGGLVMSRESVGDLAQSVCREVLQSMGKFDYRGEPAFRKWLCEVAMSKIRSRQRRILSDMRNPAKEESLDGGRGSEIDYPDSPFRSPSQLAIGKEELARVAIVFEKLSEDYQQVITLSRVFGMSHADIAVEMDRSEGAVRVLLHRALVRLAKLMEPEER